MPSDRYRLGAVAFAFFALALLVFFALPALMVTDRELPDAAARLKAENDIRTTGLQLIGGTVLALGAYLTWQNVLTNREARHIEREAQITERFTRAIDQLGSKALDVRLGGIYGMERIARDSRGDHGPVMEVLTAYVRKRAPWPPEPTRPGSSENEVAVDGADVPQGAEDNHSPPGWPPTDVQAALTVICRRHLAHEDGHRLSGLALTDLRGANLMEAELGPVDLGGANLQGASFVRAVLEGTNLQEAILEGADLQGAKLRSAHVRGVKVAGALYNSHTRWPYGFEPEDHGATRVPDPPDDA